MVWVLKQMVVEPTMATLHHRAVSYLRINNISRIELVK